MPKSDAQWTRQSDQVIPSQLAGGRRLLDELLVRLEALHWSERDIFSIHLSVDEALVNAMLHGNAMDETKRIRFRRQISPTKVRVEIVDEGPGFDPDLLPDPTDADHLSKPCGRGVMLMRSFMSRVEFHDRGNHVVLEKDRGESQEPSPSS